MFISPVAEESGERETYGGQPDLDQEYRTASELFDIMARNHDFQCSDCDSLSARDLVILYENIDLGTKLMSGATEKKTNQHVETVIYDDPESDSDYSDLPNTEDIRNAILINEERIDLLTNKSLHNCLCPKLGNFEMQTPAFKTKLDTNILLNDPVLKEQLKSLNFMTNSEALVGSAYPPSLLDYICCKKLEDNYVFYMDNIILYVKHTIDQLKRISNGDYLTEKVKEKWKEVDNTEEVSTGNNTKVLENYTSIPLHVQKKVSGHVTTWDDIVHSEIDVRCLSKILEKKVFIEIPKMIHGTFKLYSKFCADNLIISCKKEKSQSGEIVDDEEESRMEVVFKLERSKSGHVVSNISSVMVLQKSLETQRGARILPIVSNYDKVIEVADETVKQENLPLEISCSTNENNINECHNQNETYCDSSTKLINKECTTLSGISNGVNENGNIETDGDSSYYFKPKNDTEIEQDMACDPESDSLCVNRLISDNVHKKFNPDIIPDELRWTMQRLNIQTSLPEESLEDVLSLSQNPKRKSPQRVRIKSPYENASHILEEKKRKKLLEIREKRERRKVAMTENCKVMKPKYTKGGIVPQSSNSVTKLSISNKSFYNSIYGQSVGMLLQRQEKNSKKGGNITPEFNISDPDAESNKICEAPNGNKYINRSFYLDDTISEMMYLQMKQKKGDASFSESTSALSTDHVEPLEAFGRLMTPISITDISESTRDILQATSKKSTENDVINECAENAMSANSNHDILKAPVNSPNTVAQNKERYKGERPTKTDFRKSINRIYNLMNKIGKNDSTATKQTKFERNNFATNRKVSPSPCCESVTSDRQHASTIQSPNNFEKPSEVNRTRHINRRAGVAPNVVPKVIITTKSHTSKAEEERNVRRKSMSPVPKMENPLKAISQLLHDIDNVQQQRHKSGIELRTKSPKTNTESKFGVPRQNFNKPKLNEISKGYDQQKIREKRKLGFVCGDNAKINENLNKTPKKPISEIMDEYKEARGEAVRGPSRWMSRLNSLAQPKKAYVQATIEECQARYGKNPVTERLQRLVAMPQNADKRPLSPRRRQKMGGGGETIPPVSHPSPTLERAAKRNLAGNSPDHTNMPVMNEMSKEKYVPDRPSILKKKMVVAESYVKDHCGRATSPARRPEPVHKLLEGLTTRVPLLPRDLGIIDDSLSSLNMEESSALGQKLHNMVDSLFDDSSSTNQTAISSTWKDTVISETKSKRNVNFMLPQSLVTENASNDIRVSKSFENEDDIKLEVRDCISVDENIFINTTETDSKIQPMPVQPFSSETELEILETALHRHLSVGTFQKRLKIKNFTITPKPSLVILQSAEVGPMLVNTAVTQNIRPKSENLSDIRTSISHINLNFSAVPMPMQFSTVGYAFPMIPSKEPVNSEVIFHHEEKTQTTDSLSRCMGYTKEDLKEISAQVDFKEMDSPSIINGISGNAINDLVIVKPPCEKNAETNTIKPEMCESSSWASQTMLSNEIKNNGNLTEPINNITPNDILTPMEAVDYTSSLDILAGLLNEIQNITTCQTQIANSKTIAASEDRYDNDRTSLNESIDTELQENHIVVETVDIISISSLEKLRHLESTPSIISRYLSNDENKSTNFELLSEIGNVPIQSLCDHDVIVPVSPICDHGVSVETPDRINQLTDTSSLVNHTVNHSTYVSNSFIGILSQPSNQSIYPSCGKDKIIDIQEIYDDENVGGCIITEVDDDIVQTQDINEVKTCESETKSELATPIHKNKITLTKTSTQIIHKNICMKSSSELGHSNIPTKSNTDPVLKIKRDILVTVYSILVFTVFAALSFPEMIYHS